MREDKFLDGVSNIESDVVERFVSMDNKLQKKANKPKTKGIWLRFGAIAACFVLIVSAVIVVPMLQKDNLPDVPTWDTAQYSAEDIAKLFDSMKLYDASTNAYTKIYVPDSKYLYIGNMTNDEYLKLYRHTRIDKELNEAELRTFIDAFLPELAESLNAPIPQYSIKENNDSTGNNLSARVDIGPYYLSVSQNTQRNSLGLSKLNGNMQIVIDGA